MGEAAEKDGWTEAVRRYLSSRPGRGATTEMLRAVVGAPDWNEAVRQESERRLVRILRALGYQRARREIEGRRQWGYFPGATGRPVEPHDEPVARFVAETCRVGDGESASSHTLWVAYQRWVGRQGPTTVLLTQTAFGRRLSDLGYPPRKDGGGRITRHGLSVAPQAEPTAWVQRPPDLGADDAWVRRDGWSVLVLDDEASVYPPSGMQRTYQRVNFFAGRDCARRARAWTDETHPMQAPAQGGQ